jgi:anti-sigma B factor antagonist
MPQAKVAMNVRKVSDRICTVDILGEVTAFAENVVMDAYTEATTSGARSIILNFGGLDYMNSSGIGLLVTLLIRANRQGQRLLAVGLSDHYQHIFELTRLNEAIRIYPTEAEAIEHGTNP